MGELIESFPKPKYLKVRKIKTSSLFTESEWAYQKGKEKHHIYGGPNRKLSEQYGLYVYLWPQVHQSITDVIDKELIKWLKQEAQGRFETLWGHELWMQVFKRNYL